MMGKGHEEDFRLLVMSYFLISLLVQFVCSIGKFVKLYFYDRCTFLYVILQCKVYQVHQNHKQQKKK